VEEKNGSDSSFVRVLSKHQESKRNHVTFVCLRISPDVSWSQSACSTQPKQKAPIHHPCQPSTQQHSPSSHYEIPPPYHLPHPCSAPCQVLKYFIHLHSAPSFLARKLNFTSQHHLRQHPANVSPTPPHDHNPRLRPRSSDWHYQSKLAIQRSRLATTFDSPALAPTTKHHHGGPHQTASQRHH
jgi:hypothetical protein